MTWGASSVAVAFTGATSVSVQLDGRMEALPPGDAWINETRRDLPAVFFQVKVSLPIRKGGGATWVCFQAGRPPLAHRLLPAAPAWPSLARHPLPRRASPRTCLPPQFELGGQVEVAELSKAAPVLTWTKAGLASGTCAVAAASSSQPSVEGPSAHHLRHHVSAPPPPALPLLLWSCSSVCPPAPSARAWDACVAAAPSD